MLNKPTYLRQLWSETRWILLGGVWLASLLLGYAGIARFSAENYLNWSASDIFYRTLQLIVLESGAVSGSVNWMLETARFLLPFLAAYTTLQALSNLFREQMQWMRLWGLRDHAVICGLGRKGGHLTSELLKLSHPVVAIEQHPEQTRAAELQRRGAILLTGNATRREVLTRARLSHARYLICLLGGDSQNLQVAFQAYQLARQGRKSVLTCIIHIDSFELLNLIKPGELTIESGVPFLIETFHPYVRTACWLIQQDPAWQDRADPFGLPDHLLVVGLGRLGEHLVVQAARAWYRSRQSSRLTVTVMDRQAVQKTAALLRKYPPVGRTCQFIPLNVELSATASLWDSLAEMKARRPFRRVYICLGNPVLSLQVCWTLLEIPELRDVPIRVRLDRQSGFWGLLQKPMTTPSYNGQIIPFDMMEYACSAELVMGGLHELLARELHQRYLEGIDPSSPHLSWDQLSDEEKEANRQQAARICAVLSAAGYRVIPLQDWDAEDMTFPPQDVERMARQEHELWSQAKREAGWRLGLQKDARKRIHPDLVAWEQLPEEEKKKNRDFIRQLPSLLARLGFQIERLPDS